MASGTTETSAATYDPKTDPTRKVKSNDPGWKYAYWKNKTKRDVVTCTLCDKNVPGGIKRLKQHLAGGYGDALLCANVTSEIRKEMEAYLQSKRRRPSYVDHEEDEEEDEVVEVSPADATTTNVATAPKKKPSSGTAAKRRHAIYQFKKSKPAASPKTPQAKKSIAEKLQRTPEQVVDERRAKGYQPTMEASTKTKEQRRYVCLQWALWFMECGVPFNAINSRQFEIACEATAQYGAGFKPPSNQELGESLLQECVKLTSDMRKDHELAWQQYGCTLMSDGRWLIVLLVHQSLQGRHVPRRAHNRRSHAASRMEEGHNSDVEEVGGSGNDEEEEDPHDDANVSDNEDATNDANAMEQDNAAAHDEFDDGFYALSPSA